jgi:hypothetical protein
VPDSSVSLQDHPIIDQSALVGWTTREWDSFCLPKKIFLRVARDPVGFFSSIFFSKNVKLNVRRISHQAMLLLLNKIDDRSGCAR